MELPNKIQEERKKLVDQIVADMKEGKVFFWDKGFTNRVPVNAVTGKKYRGGNAISLMVKSSFKGYADPRWCTFKQAKEQGWHVRRGEKATPVEVWKSVMFLSEQEKTSDEKEDTLNLEEQTIKIKKVRYYKVAAYDVFNAEQIEGIPKLDERTPEEMEAFNKQKTEDLEQLIKNSEAAIYYDQLDQNYYIPAKDEIHLVPRESFHTMDDFYATASHEIAHSTGAEHRLNRDTKNRFGTKDYAKEELRAEIASMFIMQEYALKFDNRHYENHAAYIESWATKLAKDPDELYRAAADAQKIVDYMHTHMIERDRKKDETLEQAQENAPKMTAAEKSESKTPSAERPKHGIQRTIEIKPRKKRVVARRKPVNEKGRSAGRSR